MKFNNLIKISFLCLIILSCSKSVLKYEDYDDVEVNIKRFYIKSLGEQNRKDVIIDFTVENTGTKSIEYWVIGFRVLIESGPSIETSDRMRRILHPGDISSTMNVSATITYSNSSVVSDVIFNHFEVSW